MHFNKADYFDEEDATMTTIGHKTMMTTTITSTKRMTRQQTNATTNPNATKIAGYKNKNDAGQHMYP